MTPFAIETPPLDSLREHLHRMWSSVAGAWEANTDFIDERGEEVTRELLGATTPRSGERVLELAAGPGGPAFAAAELVGPGGEVVQSDVSREMVAIAAARATSLGLANVRSRVLDLEHLDERDASFDVVLCREGLMLVPDPGRAAREMRRVLRPGGRLALTVWGPRSRNPWLDVVFDAVSAELGVPTPPPGVPNPFSLDDADRLGAILSAAGFADVEVRELATPYRAATTDEWWERTTALAGPLAQRLAALPPEAASALRERAVAAIAPFAAPAGLEIPGVSLLAYGTS
jgi:ubiquinone/menaquinone biosynthesis C-methylase UbiE